MIFVTVGTNHARFDRLLSPFLDWVGTEELVVQHGPSPLRPRAARCSDFLPYEESVAAFEAARVIVTHAGVGSVLLALAQGKSPVVVPRLHRFGEAVDDHQQAFAARLADEGLVMLVDLEQQGAKGLFAAIAAAPDACVSDVPPTLDLALDLQRYVRSAVLQ